MRVGEQAGNQVSYERERERDRKREHTNSLNTVLLETFLEEWEFEQALASGEERNTSRVRAGGYPSPHPGMDETSFSSYTRCVK